MTVESFLKLIAIQIVKYLAEKKTGKICIEINTIDGKIGRVFIEEKSELKNSC